MRAYLFAPLAGFASLTLLGACGDDSTTKQVDAAVQSDAPKPIDAAPDAAHVFKGYDADEGGEVRVEYISFPNGNFATRGNAYFLKDPGTTKFHDFVTQMGCTNISGRDTVLPAPGGVTGAGWPFAQSPDAVEMDVGASVTLISETPGDPVIQLPKNTTADWRDPLMRLRKKDLSYQDTASPAANETALYKPATYYDVVIPGSADMPSTVIDKGIYMPASFDLTSPGFSTTPVAFTAATDATFTWTVPTQTLPAGTEVFSLLAIFGEKGPAVVCVEPNDGSVTVPGALIDVAIANKSATASKNSIARQTLVHQVRELVDNNGPTGRRIDLVGVWCYAGQPWSSP